MRRPKGIKTKKSVAKRFKITATGKVLRFRAGRRHLATTKNAKRLRRLGKVTVTWTQPMLIASRKICRSAIAADYPGTQS